LTTTNVQATYSKLHIVNEISNF